MNNLFPSCLSLTLLLVNTLCLCNASAQVPVQVPASHNMHAEQAGHEHHQPAQEDCDHIDCASNCLDAVTFTAETSIQVQTLTQPSIQDDDGDDGDDVNETLNLSSAPGTLSTGPPDPFLLAASSTPVTRHDLLLE